MGQLTQPKSIHGAARTGRRIYEMLRSEIADGTRRAGERLPSTRALAADLVVSRTTVTAVYEQLAAEGYIETSHGARPRVSAGAAQPDPARRRPHASRSARAPRLSAYGRRAAGIQLPAQLAPLPPANAGDRPAIEFLYGALSAADFPTLAWRRAYDAALLQRQSRLGYAPPEGEPELRAELQGYLRRARGLSCDAGQILIVHGSQQAIELCSRVLVDSGDQVLVEDPCYIMARYAFEAVGARVIGMPVDEQGLVTPSLTRERATLAYVTPSHQFPLGGVMPIARRQELLAWAARTGAWIVEDDYDGEFRYGLQPVDALQSIDEAGAVIYVGTFSKGLSPQLRLGYMVLPTSLVAVFRQAKRLTDHHAPRLEQAALASLIRSGAYERHIRRVRRENERRRSALLQAIERHLPRGTRVEGAASGLHVVLWLEQVHARDEARLVDRARQEGVGVWPLGAMYAAGHSGSHCAGLVLGYASLDLPAIDEGIRRLALAVAGMRVRSVRA